MARRRQSEDSLEEAYRIAIASASGWSFGSPLSMHLYLHPRLNKRKTRLLACHMFEHCLEINNIKVMLALKRVRSIAETGSVRGELEQINRMVNDLDFSHKAIFRQLLNNKPESALTGVICLLLHDCVPATAATVNRVANTCSHLILDVAGNPLNYVCCMICLGGGCHGCKTQRGKDPLEPYLKQNIYSMARTIYAEQKFEELPVLADALEDMGCDEPTILTHLREPGLHVRGCWALDRLMGCHGSTVDRPWKESVKWL